MIVSAQRFVQPATGVIGSLPTSLGVLPIAAMKPGHCFALPLAAGEAAWLGVLGPGEGLIITAHVRHGEPAILPAVVIGCLRAYPGMPTADGYATIDLLHVRSLSIAHADATAVLRVVDHPTFAQATGQPVPSPLDPGAGFCGRRLP